MPMMTNHADPYRRMAKAIGAYQTAASHPQVHQVVRLLDGLMAQLVAAERADVARQPADELKAVETAVTILRGLRAMLDLRQGPIAKNLQQTYRTLTLSVMGICMRPASNGQYLALYEAVRELRNAWAGIAGLSLAAPLPPDAVPLAPPPAADTEPDPASVVALDDLSAAATPLDADPMLALYR